MYNEYPQINKETALECLRRGIVAVNEYFVHRSNRDVRTRERADISPEQKRDAEERVREPRNVRKMNNSPD